MGTSSLDSLSLRRKVASLSLFYRYYFGRCSLQLASCIPPPLERPRNTRQSANAHRSSVSIANSRVDSFDNCFFPSTSKLWNSLHKSVFPNSYNLSSFKRHVYHHLRGGLNVLFYVKKSFFFKPFFKFFIRFYLFFFTLFINSLQPELDKGEAGLSSPSGGLNVLFYVKKSFFFKSFLYIFFFAFIYLFYS